MVEAETFAEFLPGIFRWEAYSPEHKVELTSHAVLLDGELWCFDPIPLNANKAEELTRKGTPQAIVLTNGNHERDARTWQARWGVPVWAAADAGIRLPGQRLLPSRDGSWKNGWELISLEGGGTGETAFYCEGLSVVMVGDAIVNLPYRHLEILPAKYCVNRSLLEANLRKLASRSFDKLCSAHGPALSSGAATAVQMLLG